MSELLGRATGLHYAISAWRRTGTRYAFNSTQIMHTLTDDRIASHRSTAAPRTTSSQCADIDIRIRHDARTIMDRQQPSEYVHARPVPGTVKLTTLQGRVTSFYGPHLERYTSYRGHAPPDGPVKQFLFTEKGILSISKNSVHYSHRRGLTQWHLTYVGCGRRKNHAYGSG